MNVIHNQLIRTWYGRITLVFCLLCFVSANADAHLVSTGLGPVYDGIGHFILSPVDLTVVIVLALLASMRGARYGRLLLVILPAAWISGSITGLLFPINTGLGWLPGISFLLPGILVAADRNLPVQVVGILASLLGILQGFLTGVALTGTPSAGLDLTGEIVAMIVVITISSGVVVSIKKYWMRIVVRVLGSWIAATGLLIIGWSLRALK
jgi:hydrogenase/urease accessory protein HupE